jgi:hypothetical protein
MNTCQVCGKELAHVTMHERTQHGIYRRGPKAQESQRRLSRQANAARARAAKAEKRSTAAVHHAEVVTVPMDGFGGRTPRFEVMPFVVLGTEDGGIWLAERIR